MNEPARRKPLLTDKGRLSDPCWAVDDIFIYNKERARPASRRREWEFYQAFNERFALQLYYGHGPGGGRAYASLIDFETEETFTSGARQLFCGDAFDLDFTGGEQHSLKYEDAKLFLSVDSDGTNRRLVVRSDKIDAELSFSDYGEAVVTACPFALKNQFLYQYKRVFPDFDGHVHMHKLNYALTEDTVLCCSSGRGVLPYRTQRIWAVGGMMTDAGYLALSLGEDNGPDDAPTENAVFFDGVMEKLRRVVFRFKEDNLMRRWRITDGKHVHLEFTPDYDGRDRVKYLTADVRLHRLYGRASGTVTLEDETEIRIENMNFCVEIADERR